jgi:hypothetical protein
MVFFTMPAMRPAGISKAEDLLKSGRTGYSDLGAPTMPKRERPHLRLILPPVSTVSSTSSASGRECRMSANFLAGMVMEPSDSMSALM